MFDINHEVGHLREEAERRLGGADTAPFSAHAFQTLKMKVSDYVGSLIAESAKISQRVRADVISAAHVEQANEYLVTSSPKRVIRHVGTIGGILLGASVSNILSMVTTNQYSSTGVLVSASLAVLGASGVAYHIGRD